MEAETIKLKDIKPALSSHIRESQLLLGKAPVPSGEVVHDVRVLMKKSRAILKLVAHQAGLETVPREIIALREVGRKMSAWRETPVLRKNLRAMRKEYPGLFERLAGNEKITSLLRKPEDDALLQDYCREDMEMISSLLHKTGYRIRFLTMNRLDTVLLLQELESTYGKVVDIYLSCRNNPRPGKMHELRKRAKDFLYQLAFFKPLNPGKVKLLEKRTDSLTRQLGRYNDLSQLVRALDYKYSAGRNDPALDELVIRIREIQDSHLEKIWPGAYSVFRPGQKVVNLLGFKTQGG